jgi:N-methylhydantoinase B
VERSGDLQAQVAAHAAGERRMLALLQKYGPGELSARFEDIMSHSEALTRAAISQIPHGEYEFEDRLDDDGFGAGDISIRVRIAIEGDNALVDFDGTSGPVTGPFNCPRAVTLAAVSYVFRCVTGEDIPANAGSMRPVRIDIPEGCLLDAKRPSAVAGGNVETSQRIVDTLLGALADALPALIPAASCGTMTNLSIGSLSGAGGAFSYYETVAGGTGGHPAARGASATHSHMTNTLNTPVEALEYAYPLRVLKYAIRQRSGGAGEHPGGDGLIREIEATAGCSVTLLADRRRNAPWGLSGGRDGARGKDSATLRGRKRNLPSKCELTLEKGDSIEVRTPGGGGWGPPSRRGPGR